MELKESGQNYLESIYILKKHKEQVRSIDVAKFTGYSRASVSRAMSILKDSGYVVMDGDDFLHLTEKGNQLAAEIYDRHVVIRDLFIDLGVEEKIAEHDACRIEHYLSKETYSALKKHAIEEHNVRQKK